MTSPLPLLVLAAPLAFLGVAAVAAMRPGARPRAVERMAPWAAWSGVAVAAFAGVLTARRGLVESGTVGWEGLGLSLRIDPLSASMLGMIALLAVVIVRYSTTYLDGDERHGLFLGRLALTIAAVEVLVLAGNLGLLVLAWVATSLALHRLLVFYPQRRGAVLAARKKFVAARIGDAFLVAAGVLLFARFGTGNLQQIFDAAPDVARDGLALGALEAAALCLAVAAALKSAQFPMHGWLVEVMETPTPVSALLHAGILNAGPFLVIRMAGIVDGADVATALLIAVGGLTALFASVSLLTQPAIKTVLAYSSAAHMGFMLMVCGVGLFPAAFLHLVAHSFYKAHAFLSSGSVVDEVRAAKVALPARVGRPSRILASFGVALGAYLGFALVWGVDLARQPALVAVGAVLVLGLAQIVAPALDSDGPVAGTVRAVGAAVAVTAAFFVLESGAHALLDGTLPDTVARGPVHLALMGVVLVTFTTVVVLQILEPTRPPTARRRAWAVHFRNGLYVNTVLDRALGALRPAPATATVDAR
jgi:NAD(P)H-quinone oxidoreductase subunit 5